MHKMNVVHFQRGGPVAHCRTHIPAARDLYFRCIQRTQNSFHLPPQCFTPSIERPLVIAQIYKCRLAGGIIFFKWIKQHLRIKAWVSGTSRECRERLNRIPRGAFSFPNIFFYGGGGATLASVSAGEESLPNSTDFQHYES